MGSGLLPKRNQERDSLLQLSVRGEARRQDLSAAIMLWTSIWWKMTVYKRPQFLLFYFFFLESCGFSGNIILLCQVIK